MLFRSIGLSDPPLSYSFLLITSLAPPSWLATSWEFLNDFQGSLKFNNPWHLPLDREVDCHLMAQVLEHLIDITSPCLTCSEHQKFNLCRLYLQVITLSAITNSSGTEIDIHFWKGNRSLCTSNLNGPSKPFHLHNAGSSDEGQCTYSSPHCTS